MLHKDLTAPQARPVTMARIADEPTPSLSSLTDDVLLDRAATIVARSRSTEVDLILHLAEIDARRLYAREGCPSMFVYCTLRLRFSEAEAYLRITAARASREHPSLSTALRDGRLHLSALSRLAPHLTRDNLEWLVTRAAGRSKREVMELVADLTPKPDAPTKIRVLPRRSRRRGARCPRREPRPARRSSVRTESRPRPPATRRPRLSFRPHPYRTGPWRRRPPVSSPPPPDAIASSSPRTARCGTSSTDCVTCSAWRRWIWPRRSTRP